MLAYGLRMRYHSDMGRSRFGLALRRARGRVSRAKLGAKLGVDPTTLYKIETRGQEPRHDLLAKLIAEFPQLSQFNDSTRAA